MLGSRLPVFLVLATLMLLAASPALAAFPADSDWNPITAGGQGIGDPVADGASLGREVVGDSSNPAAYVYADLSTFSVRIRLDVDPRQAGMATDLRPFFWAIAIDTDEFYEDHEFVIHVDGIIDEVAIGQNFTKTGLGDPGDPAETVMARYPLVDGTNIRVLLAPTTSNGNPDFFIDFSFPVTDVFGSGLALDRLTYWVGTSTSGFSISSDLANHAGSPGLGTLATSASDLMDIGGIDDLDGDGVLNGADPGPFDPTIPGNMGADMGMSDMGTSDMGMSDMGMGTSDMGLSDMGTDDMGMTSDMGSAPEDMGTAPEDMGTSPVDMGSNPSADSGSGGGSSSDEDEGGCAVSSGNPSDSAGALLLLVLFGFTRRRMGRA